MGILTRRGIRIKVMQVVYMIEQDTGHGKPDNILRDLLGNSFKAYLYVINVLTRLAGEVEEESNRRKSKYITTEADLHFNTTFADNLCMQYLRHADVIRDACKKHAIDSYGEEELITAMYHELREFPPYQEYLGNKEAGTDAHRKLLRKVCTDFLPFNEAFDLYMEAMVTTWTDDESAVMKQMDELVRHLPVAPDRESALFEDRLDEEDKEYAFSLLHHCLEESDRYGKMIEEKLKNWELERVSVLDRILMKLAITEFIHQPSIPLKVTINEYLEISKQYSTPKSREFINGVLDKIMVELKKEGTVVKTGRGLIE